MNAIYNPKGVSEDQLPVIYGFANTNRPGWMEGVLLAQDGTPLGSHICSNEGYMLHDLGIVEGSRPDRHETFKQHYPDGYRMEFVGYDDVDAHVGLQKAFKAHDAMPSPKEKP